MTRYRSAVMIFLLVTACHSAPARTEPEPENSPKIQPAPTSRPLSTVTRWVLQPSTHTQRYRSTTTAVISLGNAAPAIHDSSLSTVDFSLSITREPKTASYSATIEASMNSGGTRFSQHGGTVKLPFSVAGQILPGRLTVDASFDCNNEINTIIPVIQRALVVSPLQLQKDMTWTDSTDVSICSGPVPVSLTGIRSYRVIGETKQGDLPAILLERKDRTFSSGEAAEGQHRLQVKSQGSGLSTIFLDAQTGALLNMTTINSTTVEVTVSGRTQQFIQNSRERITRY